MKKISADAVSYSKNLNFSFSNTLRNQQVNFNDYASATFIIDVDGTVYQSASSNESSANIIVIGGINKFINEKASRVAVNNYVTVQQKITLYNIIKGTALILDDAVISSDNTSLELMLNALYSNLCG